MSETMLATRDAYGKTLVELGKKYDNLIVLDADLSSSTRTNWFAKEYPKKFFNVGVAEQNLIGMSAGFALAGKIVFASSFAMFCTGRPWEMIRNSIAYPRLSVKIVATHAGITVGEDGATHQANEDIAIMRAIPNMTVVAPADYYETVSCIRFAAKASGPWYIRLSRSSSHVVYDQDHQFELHTSPVVKEGSDISIAACGIMLYPAIVASNELLKEGISAEVLNVHTIKPLPFDNILKSIQKTKLLVTAEEHNLSGGMASAILEKMATSFPVPVEFVCLQDTFGESGKPAELLEKYHLNANAIIEAAKRALKRKKNGN